MYRLIGNVVGIEYGAMKNAVRQKYCLCGNLNAMRISFNKKFGWNIYIVKIDI